MSKPMGPPQGRCPDCEGPLTWGRLAYERPASLLDAGRWIGLDAVCATGLREPRHPCSPQQRDRPPQPLGVAVAVGAGSQPSPPAGSFSTGDAA